MRGRPKKDDSRDNQYRVRLNDEENRMLTYVSELTVKAKSEIFRIALKDYYNKTLLNELHQAEASAWEMERISLVRAVKCPHCGSLNRVDLEDESEATAYERPMGSEILYEFNCTQTCGICKSDFTVSGFISEYPEGALNSEDIKVASTDE